MCGQDVFAPGFTVVDVSDDAHEQQKNFFERFKTSHKISCTSPIEKIYYSTKGSRDICYKCISDLSDREDILEKIQKAKLKYSVVLPTCLSVECGKFMTSNQKRPKRPAPGARPAAKKRRRGDAGN